MSAALKALRDLTATNRAASDGKAHEGKAPQPAPKTAPVAPVVANQLQQVAQEAAASANQRQAQNLSDAIQELNGEYFLAPEGGKVCVWREMRDYELDRPLLVPMTPTDFKALHGNRKYPFTGPSGNTQTVSLGAAWLTDTKRREYLRGMALLPGQEAPEGVYNLWQGWGAVPAAGDVKPALWHIKHVVCGGDAALAGYLVQWMAWAVQNPGKQAEVAIVLQGKKGTGKGTLGRWLLEIFGSHGLHILHRRHLVGNFNAHLRMLCFAFADEAFFAGDHEGQAVIKGLITEDQITIERKGVDAYAVRNRLKVLMATNEKWVVPATEDERRYCVIEVSDCKRGDHAYFGELEKHMREGGLAALLDYLLNLDLSRFNIRRVPNTAALEQQKILSLEPLPAWIFSKLCDGRWNEHDAGWTAEKPRAQVVGEFATHVKDTGKRYVSTAPEVVGRTLHELFPSLRDARESKGTRQRTWVFPELEQARAEFAEFVGLTYHQWPEDN